MEEEDDDMISSLPDEILRHIVSFLPTREAFTTTVLSKRWKSVWQWASGTSACIDFDDGCYTKSRDSYHLFIRTVCLACLAFEFYRNLPLQTSPKLLRAHVSATQTCFLITEVVYNAHFLHLDNIYHRLLYEPHWMYHYSTFPIFHNLIHLQLVYQPYNAHWSQVVQLLHHFPKLQLLVINQPDIHTFHFEHIEKIGDCQFPPSVPPCLLLSLKRCCLNDYRGTKPEFEFARYIMQNGICLKNMTISSGIAKDRKFKMLKELSSCKRGSATCKLSFK